LGRRPLFTRARYLRPVSKENLETTRRAIEAGNRGDIDGIMAEYGPDPMMRMPREGPNPGTHQGREAIRRFFEDFYGEWEEFVIDIVDLIEGDQQVIGTVHWRGFSRRYGIEVSQPGAFIYSFDGGKISGVSFFQTKVQALRAAELAQ
jgi:ketosteroid isomerase-like protein